VGSGRVGRRRWGGRGGGDGERCGVGKVGVGGGAGEGVDVGKQEDGT
jgi:hypothetical protein